MADKDGAVVDEYDPTGTTLLHQQSIGGGSGTPFGVAVDQASGIIYVADSADAVINVYDSSWNLLWQIDGSATPAGSFSGLRHIAVDQATGNLYVTDPFSGAVDVFGPSTASAAGSYIRQLPLASAPGGSSAFPLSVAVDPTNGDVYVADLNSNVVDRFDSQGNYLSQITGTSSGPFPGAWGVGVDGSGNLYVSDGTGAVDIFSAGSYVSQLTGTSGGPFLGPIDAVVDPSNQGLYVVDGGTSSQVVDVFSGQPTPDVTVGQASGVHPTSATLNGTVNPVGVQLSDCHFDYGTTTAYGQSAPCVPAASSIPADSTVHAVTANLTGLAPGTTYHYRLQAANANGAGTAGDTTLRTPPTPTIDSTNATNLTSTAADLTAQINPKGLDSTYHIEYGPTTSYGTSIPVPDADIGSGTTDIAVTQHATGLSANTEYHWRVIATNANGTTTGIDHTFIYDTTSNTLPDHRAYEQVSPPNKNGALLTNTFLGLSWDLAADGSRVDVGSIQCFADATSCNGQRQNVGSIYQFTRTGSGWVTNAIAPPATQYSQNTPWLAGPDLGTALFSVPTPPAGQDDWIARKPGGTFVDVGPVSSPSFGPIQPAGTPGFGDTLKLATADLSHLVWASNGSLWPFDPTSSGGVSAYQYSGTGNTAPELVGVSGGAGSTSLISTCGTSLGRGDFGIPGMLSTGGSTVFFTATGQDHFACGGAQPPVDELGARIDGTLPDARTVIISQRSTADCTNSACQSSPPADAFFEVASDDGSRVFFTSTQQLTDNASEDSTAGDSAAGNGGCSGTTGQNGCNLYLYDFNNPSGHELVDVSAGDSSGGGPQVQGVMGSSTDGSHVYFVAKGVLTTTPNSQGQVATDGGENLYVYERDSSYPTGRVAFIASLSRFDASEWRNFYALPDVTPDGRFLVFWSRRDLTTDDSSSARQLFRYDAQSGQLVRVSVGNNGYNDNGNVAGTYCDINTPGECPQDTVISSPGASGFHAGPARRDPTMSDDGSRVFFTSPQALVPHALSDQQISTDAAGAPVFAQNVYEWEQPGAGTCPSGRPAGCVSLISDGKDTGTVAGSPDVRLMGTDATGADVFFTTADQLVPQDGDTELDVYDARVDGGFPVTPAQPCSGASCQGTPSGAPSPPTAATVSFSGPGNASPSTVSGRVTVLSRVVRGSTFLVTVKVPAAGKVAISGNGIDGVSRFLPRAGTYKLKVTLSAKAKRALARGHTLRLTLHVGYQPSNGSGRSASVALTVKPPLRRHHRATVRRATTRAHGGAR